MKFVLRDDDLNYFSKPEDIEKWYADIFVDAIPVAFSAIPFVKPESDVYTGEEESLSREFGIHENTELCAFVKNQPMIEILQHGTTHETKNSVFEYQNPKLGILEAVRGREELERAFGTDVSIFVPPHDWISSRGIYAVEKANMNIIRGRGAGLRNIIPRIEYLTIFLRMLLFKARYVLANKVPAYPYVLNFGKHKELCSYRLEDTDVFEGLAFAHKTNGIFVVVTHLHFYSDEKKALLLKILQKAKELDAEFVNPSSLFTRS